MNTMDTTYSRKSVRSYTGESVTEAELTQILKAAYAAPVGMKAYNTLILTVVTNQTFMDRFFVRNDAELSGIVTGNY